MVPSEYCNPRPVNCKSVALPIVPLTLDTDVYVCVHQEKREDVDWLFHCMLRSLKDALHNAGPLFAFVPEFYIEACVNAYSALKSYFSPGLLSPQSPGMLSRLTL